MEVDSLLPPNWPGTIRISEGRAQRWCCGDHLENLQGDIQRSINFILIRLAKNIIHKRIDERHEELNDTP